MLVDTHYNDGGYSGSKTERPALTRFLSDIRAGHVDMIVAGAIADKCSRVTCSYPLLHGSSFDAISGCCQTSLAAGAAD